MFMQSCLRMLASHAPGLDNHATLLDVFYDFPDTLRQTQIYQLEICMAREAARRLIMPLTFRLKQRGRRHYGYVVPSFTAVLLICTCKRGKPYDFGQVDPGTSAG